MNTGLNQFFDTIRYYYDQYQECVRELEKWIKYKEKGFRYFRNGISIFY